VLGYLPLVLMPLLLVLSGVYAHWYIRRDRNRKQDFVHRAARQGLRGFPEDVFGLDRLGMPLFEQGDQVVFSNVLLGEWDGLPFKAAELTSYRLVYTTDGKRELSELAKYSLLVAELDLRLWMPWVVLSSETLFTKAKAAVGIHDIQFESAAFNDRFHVQAEDRRFAYQLIDARMMEYLLGMAKSDLRYEVWGPRLLVALPREEDGAILDCVSPLFAAARGVAERIPRPVWSEWGAAAMAAPGRR
jgi:Protein of unknown function (DUF3137)